MKKNQPDNEKGNDVTKLEGESTFEYDKVGSDAIIRVIGLAHPCQDAMIHVKDGTVIITARGRTGTKAQYDLACKTTVSDGEHKYVMKPDQLVKLMQTCPAGKLSVKSNHVKLTNCLGNTVKGTLPLDKEVEAFPEFPATVKMCEIPKIAFDAAATISYCCQPDGKDGNMMLSYISMRVEKNRISIVAFDARRFSVAEMAVDVAGCGDELYFPPEVIKNLAGNSSKIRVGSDGNHYLIEADDNFRLAVLKPVGQSFRKYVIDLVQMPRDVMLVLPKANLMRFARQYELIQSKREQPAALVMRFQKEKDRIHYYSKTAIGMVEDFYSGAESHCTQDDFIVSLHPMHLTDVCGRLQSDLVGIQVGEKCAYIQEEGKGIKFLHATGLVNSRKAAAAAKAETEQTDAAGQNTAKEEQITAENVVAVKVRASIAALAGNFM